MQHDPSEKSRTPHSGFTLVELLVVITIIGVLIALLLPAVQAAREASRKLQCNNQLKQMALASLQHEQSNGFLPSGGWSWVWFGDPDRGFTRRQPGGWIYNILPYIEQQPLHDLGMGMSLSAKRDQLARIAQTPLAIFICPTRRQPILYPNYYNEVNSTPVSSTAHTDYAANSGTLNGSGSLWYDPGGSDPAIVDAPGYKGWINNSSYDGVIYNISCLKMTEITDGTSHTFLLGEKYLQPENYYNGLDGTDNDPIYSGFDWDWQKCSIWDAGRATWLTLLQDTPGYSNYYIFGSAHATSANMAFCDGSAKAISYGINAETFRCLCNRRDGQTMQGNSY
jgi:prepilin-type N-terminal cleavage/methylation domain-containing protein/prepilin-type processing-associated H-X9-DG protein